MRGGTSQTSVPHVEGKVIRGLMGPDANFEGDNRAEIAAAVELTGSSPRLLDFVAQEVTSLIGPVRDARQGETRGMMSAPLPPLFSCFTHIKGEHHTPDRTSIARPSLPDPNCDHLPHRPTHPGLIIVSRHPAGISGIAASDFRESTCPVRAFPSRDLLTPLVPRTWQ